MNVTCHDKTPFADFTCGICCTVLHLHRTQASTINPSAIAVTICRGCHTHLMLPAVTTILNLIAHTAHRGRRQLPFVLLPLRPGGPPAE